MKWNKENKSRLYCLLFEKRMTFYRINDYEGWESFLESFGIVNIRRDFKRGLRMKRPWFKEDSTTITNKNHVMIKHPWWGHHSSWFGHEPGLAVPKDIAEKFLVLGAP